MFFFSTITMPYANFEDNDAAKEVYDQQLQKDPDLNLGEFIFSKLLRIGQLFDSDDDDELAAMPQNLPVKNQQPLQTLQLQSGFFDCNRLVIKIQETVPATEKPTCAFIENKLPTDYYSSVFHPPASNA
ncbi:MAG: hypothetical protein B6D37_06560 [Sphingobacteriales bacterium UTBCD1]|jgi:hypothetical protein|nr:MAG: hypothetical protein B6D37_06560 [Sphingobacteriales bacterium UTBCD1]